MKKVFAALFLLVMLMTALMPLALAEDTEGTAVIGGADAPTDILVTENTENAAQEETVDPIDRTKPLPLGQSLGFMAKGLVGIFLVTAVIILVLKIMDKAGNRKKTEAEE